MILELVLTKIHKDRRHQVISIIDSEILENVSNNGTIGRKLESRYEDLKKELNEEIEKLEE